jgi:GNAT superfamily N-acetyltransferase
MNLVEMFDSYATEKGFGPRIIHFEGTGFATYHISPGECYIEDIYIVPEKRKSRLATELANQVVTEAKKHGCQILTGSVSKEANGQDISRAALIGYGFKKLNEDDTMEWYAKEI